MEKVNKSYPSAFSLRSDLLFSNMAQIGKCVCVCMRAYELLCVHEGDEQVTYA